MSTEAPRNSQQTPPRKPLGRKAYGSIGHLPKSRLGPGDHCVDPGMQRICCEQRRDRHDHIVVQEKLDGSCVSVAKINGELHALGRAGYPATTSPHKQHHLFHAWVQKNLPRFDRVLADGERICGEWLAQAHGTRYSLHHEPFVAFDIFDTTNRRLVFDQFLERVGGIFVTPHVVSIGDPMPVETAMLLVQAANSHEAIDPIEGVVYRVERKGCVDFLAKFVRPDKVDGCYLPEKCGFPTVWWNWIPDWQVAGA